MREINRIIIHCADTPNTMDIGTDKIREWHKERGFADIGYHYVIRRDGTLELGRSLNVVGAHCSGYNHGSIGICIIGGKHTDKDITGLKLYTTAQLNALKSLVKDLKVAYPNACILGHNELTTEKTCPNFNVPEWVKENKLDDK